LQPFFLSFAVAKVETIFELANISDKNFAEILLCFLLYMVLSIDNQMYNDVFKFSVFASFFLFLFFKFRSFALFL